MTLQSAMKQLADILPDSEDRESSRVRNVNAMHDDTMTLGQTIADGVARNMGSWRFIIIQSSFLVAWILANALFAVREYSQFGLNIRAWDPYPFILLNLALSFQAAYAAPFIMMSQNRQADKDRLAAEHDYLVNIRAEATIVAVLNHLKAQDDVIITILRQLARIHGIKPDAAQLAAEKRLQEVSQTEAVMLRHEINAQEREAGLRAQKARA
jgi:uncharacterized membrane protein